MNNTDPHCICLHYSDGSVYKENCPLHATLDPCAVTAQITGRRRKGTIRRGVCTNCGHDERRNERERQMSEVKAKLARLEKRSEDEAERNRYESSRGKNLNTATSYHK